MSKADAPHTSPSGPFLICGFGGIGDHVRCFALARHVAVAHPGVAIDFLCRSPTHRLVPFVPDLRKAFIDDTPHGRLGLREKLDLAARLRREGYQRVYVVSRAFKAAIVPFLAGIPERVGWLGEGRIGLINRPRTGDRAIYGETERVCALATADSQPPERILMPRLVVSTAQREDWQRREFGAAFAGPRPPVLALAPGAYNVARLWGAERFAALAAAFSARGWDIWVLGGPQERAAAAVIAAAAPIRDFTHTPLEDAVLQLACADLVLGNDSGMLHMAGAVGVPSLGLFGPTVLEITGPRNPTVSGLRPPDGSIDLADIAVCSVETALLALFSRQ